MKGPSDAKIGEFLVRQGTITESQLKKALKVQQKTGEQLRRIILALRFCSSEQYVTAIGSEAYGREVLYLNNAGAPVGTLNEIRKVLQTSDKLAKKHGRMPSPAEIARATRFPIGKVQRLLAAAEEPVSPDQPDGEDEDTTP